MYRFEVTFTKHFVGGNLDGLNYPLNKIKFADLNTAHDYMNWLDRHSLGSAKVIKGFGGDDYQASDIVLDML